MGDANVSPGDEPMNIDTLRKLALLSMLKRQGRNLTICSPSLKSEGPTGFPSPAAKPPEDKEEGELSSDDDAEGATATYASVEPASDQDPAALKSHLPSQGSTKEMLAPGGNFTGSKCNEELSTASVAEAFLASLRIPIPKSSRAPGDDKKEEDFVIKFDEDSDSDGEHQPSLSFSSTLLGSNAEKVVPGRVSVPNTTPVLHSYSAGPPQKPSGLKSEIDRMKKQIAAMERSKGKPPVLPVLMRSTRVISADTTRSSVSTATDTKSVVQVGTGNLRSVPDLESLRLQIAAKESELQQRRQRLAAKGPEASKVSSAAKGTGVGVPITPLPPLSKTNKEGNYLAGPAASSAGNVSADKTLLPIRKEALNQAEGLIALASIGAPGVCLLSNKKDMRIGGGDSCLDRHNVNEDMTMLPSSRAGTYPSNSVGRQLVSKVIKRSHAGFEPLVRAKVPRVDSSPPPSDNQVRSNTPKEPSPSELLPVTGNGTCKTLSVQVSSQTKRKVDDTEVTYKSVMEMPGPSNPVGCGMSKKLKLTTQSTPGDVSQVERFSNSISGLAGGWAEKQDMQTLQTSTPHLQTRPMWSPALEGTEPHTEKAVSGITLSSVQAVGSASVSDDITLRSIARGGEDVIRGEQTVIASEEVSPSERFGGARVKSTEVPMLGLENISANEDEHVPKIQKPRFQYEGSHALPALAGVSVPYTGVTEPDAIIEPSVKKHDVSSSNQQVREGINVKTGMYLRPSSVQFTPEAHLGHSAQQSLGFGHSYADDWDVNPDAETFEQLQAEEEMLDKELEKAREERQRCELRERVARKEYRDTQKVLREVNAQCDLLNQRKEFLLSRIHLVEGRQYSRKVSTSRKPWLISSVDNSSLRLTGLEVAPPCNPEKPATSIEYCAVSLPLHQPSRGPGSCGADGGQMLAIQVAESQGPPGVKHAGNTTVVQTLWKDPLSSEVEEDVGSISRVPSSDGALQGPVAHGGDVVVGIKYVDSGHAGKLGISASTPQTECVDLPPLRAFKAVAISSSTLKRGLQNTAVRISGSRAHDDGLSVAGQHVAFSAGGLEAPGFDIRSERTMAECKQVQAESDASLPVSGQSEQQAKESLAITSVSHSSLPTPVITHEYVQTTKVGIYAAAGMQDRQAALGSSTSNVEPLVEERRNLSQHPCIVSGGSKQRMSSVVSGADEGKKLASTASMTTNKEEKAVLQKMLQMLVEKGTVENDSKVVQVGSSGLKVVDVCIPELLVAAASADVGIRRDFQFDSFQTPREPKSAASGVLEVDSSLDVSLKGLSRSIHDTVVSSSIVNKGLDAPDVRDTDDGASGKKAEGQGFPSSMVDGKRDEGFKTGRLVVPDAGGPSSHSAGAGNFDQQQSDNSEDLATDHQGFSREGISLNGVEEPELDTGINLSDEVTEGECQLLGHQELDFSGAVSEGNKPSPTASNSENSQKFLSETRRRSRAECEDLPSCTKHVRSREHKTTMSSNKFTEEEAMCRPTGSVSQLFGDMDTMELDEEIRSNGKLEMSKNVKEAQHIDKLKLIEGTEDRSSLSQPRSGLDSQGREKAAAGTVPSMERQSLPAIETVHTKEQYPLTILSATCDNGFRINDHCSSEVVETQDLTDQRPTENYCPPGRDREREQDTIVSPDSHPQLVSLCAPVIEDISSRDGVGRTFDPSETDHEGHQKQAVALHGLENVHVLAVDHHRRMGNESRHRAISSREIGKDRPDLQNPDVLELMEPISGKETENCKGVEVEVVRKALLEGNGFKGSSRSEEAMTRVGVQVPRRDTDKEQIPPQLQHHLLSQLLNMVEVGNQGTGVNEEVKRLKGLLSAPLADNGVREAQTAQVECSERAAERTKPVHVSCEQKAEVGSNIKNREFSDGSSASEPWVPSAAGFVSLRCIRGIVASPSDTPRLDGSSNIGDTEYLPAVASLAVRPRYESPLTVFRAYRSLPQFAGAMQLSSSSNTWSHAINPHKPLCRFEHRGQCRNEHCPWQHADDYTVSTQVSPEIQNKELRKAVLADEKMDDTLSTRPKASPFVGSFPVLQNSGVGSTDKLQTSGSLLSSSGFSLQGSPSRQLQDYEISVPIYRIGYYTLKAEDPSSMRLGIPGMQRKVKTEIYHSFLLSPSIHRSLPSDSPCLLDTSNSKLSTIEANASQVPHWRYAAKLREERVFNESVSLHASRDVEMWLELALHHVDFDTANDKPKARDEALCILSRGLETKQNSVTLWMAYSCLFHTRRDNPESDDMFQFAIQYNPGSYELWYLYINSRPDLPSRLEAYERAILALVEKGTQAENLREDSSACLLDLALQMLYCMCFSGCMQDALSWVEDLIHDASTTEGENSRRISTSALLSHLTPHDACILWISCAYLSACGEMPSVITRRLGCKQDLPYTLDWDTRAGSEELARLRVMRTLSTAASSARGCLSLEDPNPRMSDNHSKEVLAVNYIQCLAFYEGLESAGRASQHLTGLYPTSVELILLNARIEERRAGSTAGLQVFEAAVSRWPVDESGLLRLWNQYAVHGLVWGGNLVAHKILCKSIPSTVLHPSDQFEDPRSATRVSSTDVPTLSGDMRTLTNLENVSSVMWNEVRERYLSLTSPSSRPDESTSDHSWHFEDMVYALINLAIIEALSGDPVSSQSTINKAMKIAVSDRDARQCWKELASLQFSGADVKEHRILRLLDRCKKESYILSQLKPLSLRVLEDLKRPRVRKFFVDLLGLLPVEHSLLNSVLEICYGPSLLPFESFTLKDVFHFAEGILEAMPGNVEVALSLCKIVFQESGSQGSKSSSLAVWASALLVSSLQQSCPAAPELYWVEAGLLLRQLRKEKALEEYYLHALVKYPFSAALRQGLEKARQLIQELDGPRRLQQEDMFREMVGPIVG